MSNLDREKWNQRYVEDSYRKNNPVTLLQDWLPDIPRGKALDVACGAGRNTICLAQAGYRVDAIDISPEGLKKARQKAAEQGLEVNWIEHDLDQSKKGPTTSGAAKSEGLGGDRVWKDALDPDEQKSLKSFFE